MKNLILSVLLLLVAACVGTSSPSRFYQLKALEGDVRPVSQRRMDIGVEEVFIPRYLDRPQIVTMEAGSSELKMSEFYRWGEPLSSSFSRVLADDISVYLPKSVVKFKTLVSENFTYTVTVEVNKMDAFLGQKKQFDAWWRVYKNGRVVARERSRLSAPLTESYEDLAEKESVLIGELAREIAVKLAKL